MTATYLEQRARLLAERIARTEDPWLRDNLQRDLDHVHAQLNPEGQQQ